MGGKFTILSMSNSFGGRTAHAPIQKLEILLQSRIPLLIQNWETTIHSMSSIQLS